MGSSIAANNQRQFAAQNRPNLLKSLFGIKNRNQISKSAQKSTTSKDGAKASSTNKNSSKQQVSASKQSAGSQRGGDKPDVDLAKAGEGLDQGSQIAGNINKGCPNCGGGGCSCKNCGGGCGCC